jgi:hypothetical protein
MNDQPRQRPHWRELTGKPHRIPALGANRCFLLFLPNEHRGPTGTAPLPSCGGIQDGSTEAFHTLTEWCQDLLAAPIQRHPKPIAVSSNRMMAVEQQKGGLRSP